MFVFSSFTGRKVSDDTFLQVNRLFSEQFVANALTECIKHESPVLHVWKHKSIKHILVLAENPPAFIRIIYYYYLLINQSQLDLPIMI